MQGGWYLILMIWGEQYTDEHCNKLIRQAMHFSENCQGAIVFSDRLDRTIDPRGRLVAIPDDFSDSEMKVGGLPVKLSMFEVEGVPDEAVCVYVDLDSVVVGSLDRVAALSDRAKLWTIPTFPRPFSPWSRFLWRVTKREKYRFGNSSAFVYRNKYRNNPTEQFRQLRRQNALPKKLRHDDRFIGWSSQDVVRGLPTSLVVNFRYEFLWPYVSIGWMVSLFRRRSRAGLALVTFAGPMTKPEMLCMSEHGSLVKDHHGRIGVWSDRYTSGVRDRILHSINL